MENKLQIFENAQFGSLRTVKIDGKIYFVVADVCKILGLTNPTVAVEKLDEDERAKFNLGHPYFETNCVNESGLYRLIFASRKPDAKKFQRWVYHEVLPIIRKHGAYMTGATLDEIADNPDLLMKLAQNLKAEREKRLAAEKTIEEQKPKVIFADAVEASQTSILVGDLAKLLKQNGVNVGQNRLFEWLRGNGYLIKGSRADWNMPTPKSMELGLFEVKERTINNPNGSNIIKRTAKVTGKGQVYFVNKLKGQTND